MWSSSRATIKSLASRAASYTRTTQALALSIKQQGGTVQGVVPRTLTAGALHRAFASMAAQAAEPGQMYCFQCEQTRHAKACVGGSEGPGVCGKTSETAALQDLLVHYLSGISQYAHKARTLGGLSDHEVDSFMLEGLFSTMNVNFDAHRFLEYLKEAERMKEKARKLYEQAVTKSAAAAPTSLRGPAQLDIHNIQGDTAKLESIGHMVGVQARKGIAKNDDVWSLGELILYGLKGMAAYAHHAKVLGVEDPKVFAFVHEAMDALADLPNQTVEGLLDLALRTGECNLLVMSLLDKGSTERYGHPVPTEVLTSPVKGKCIAVSGHDLKDLEEVLKRTEGTGINVYTHGELLPAHGYPGLKKYKHLVGNYGGGWQLQKVEFSRFPGPVIMTTNCIIEPMKGYKGRIYTRSVVGWEGVQHLDNWDHLDEIIQQAQAMPGFKEDAPRTVTTTGFARNAVLGIADKVVDAVKTGDIKHFFLVGGCDGAEANRTYFRDVALHAPKDAVVMTLGCGKYRFNKKHFDTTAGGLPRLLDVGQCNDAYSAIQIAVALAGAFKTDVNSLPLSLVISWFEQKAVAVFLTLLHLGIKGIRLGPELPAFVTPNVLKVLQDNYQLKQVGDYQQDIKDCMSGQK